MSEAIRDQNRVTGALGVLNTDGDTPVRLRVNPTHRGVKMAVAATGSDVGDTIASRDQNRVPVLLGVSSVDGVTPVEIYTDSDGNLLAEGI